jgi:Flp pilus assembly protein CpaB
MLQEGLLPLAKDRRALAIDLHPDAVAGELLPAPTHVDLIITIRQDSTVSPVEIVLREIPVLAVFPDRPQVIVQVAPCQAETLLTLSPQGGAQLYLRRSASTQTPPAEPAGAAEQGAKNGKPARAPWIPSRN